MLKIDAKFPAAVDIKLPEGYNRKRGEMSACDDPCAGGLLTEALNLDLHREVFTNG
ncbi:MAG: hypothetical protein ACLRUN_01490 [Christensenellales bacterium]